MEAFSNGTIVEDFLYTPSLFPYPVASMPKQKSHSGAKKRTRRTGGGRIVMKRGRRNPLLQQKNKRQKRLGRTLPVRKTEHKKLSSLIPNL